MNYTRPAVHNDFITCIFSHTFVYFAKVQLNYMETALQLFCYNQTTLLKLYLNKKNLYTYNGGKSIIKLGIIQEKTHFKEILFLNALNNKR